MSYNFMKETTKQVLVGTAWLITLLAVIGGTMLWQHQVRKPRHNVDSITVTSTERVPVLLLLDASLDAEQQRQLIATMQRNNGSQPVTTVQISTNGKIKFNGPIRTSDNRPYFKLVLSKGLTATKKSQLIKEAIIAAKENYHFDKYNLVCYGDGGLVATHYLEHTAPSLAPMHLVTIATAFNGTDQRYNSQKTNPVEHNQRTTNLTQLIKKRKALNPKTKVLLIAGNAKGHRNGDGVVPIQSALAGQSVFQPVIKNYQQTVIHSWHASHTHILESWKLGDAIQDFID